jgi:hypothetical protein
MPQVMVIMTVAIVYMAVVVAVALTSQQELPQQVELVCLAEQDQLAQLVE